MSIGSAASNIALWVLVTAQGIFLLFVLRQLNNLETLAQHGSLRVPLPKGSSPPSFTALDQQSGRLIESHKLFQRAAILIFLSPSCSVCVRLVNEIETYRGDDLPPVIALCEGDAEHCAALLARLGSQAQFLFPDGAEVAKLFHVTSFPAAFVVDDSETLCGSGNPTSVGALIELFTRSLEEDISRPVIEVGSNR
jgi:hypothetical protein